MRFLAASFCCLTTFLATSCSTAASASGGSEPAPTGAWLRDFGTKYSYDVGYMEQLLAASPAAFATFEAAMGMAGHRVHLPVDAHYVACISALMADDCGACTQLDLRLAVEAGVDRAVLRQLLEDPRQLPPTLRLVHEHATQVVKGGNADAARVAELRRVLGDAAFGELAVNILGSRIYPGLRRTMGAEVACPQPTLDF
jgi:hypothetical protein